MTKDEWIRNTALHIQLILGNIDFATAEYGIRVISAEDRAVLGECLDSLNKLEDDLE